MPPILWLSENWLSAFQGYNCLHCLRGTNADIGFSIWDADFQMCLQQVIASPKGFMFMFGLQTLAWFSNSRCKNFSLHSLVSQLH